MTMITMNAVLQESQQGQGDMTPAHATSEPKGSSLQGCCHQCCRDMVSELNKEFRSASQTLLQRCDELQSRVEGLLDRLEQYPVPVKASLPAPFQKSVDSDSTNPTATTGTCYSPSNSGVELKGPGFANSNDSGPSSPPPRPSTPDVLTDQDHKGDDAAGLCNIKERARLAKSGWSASEPVNMQAAEAAHLLTMDLHCNETLGTGPPRSTPKRPGGAPIMEGDSLNASMIVQHQSAINTNDDEAGLGGGVTGDMMLETGQKRKHQRMLNFSAAVPALHDAAGRPAKFLASAFHLLAGAPASPQTPVSIPSPPALVRLGRSSSLGAGQLEWPQELHPVQSAPSSVCPDDREWQDSPQHAPAAMPSAINPSDDSVSKALLSTHTGGATNNVKTAFAGHHRRRFLRVDRVGPPQHLPPRPRSAPTVPGVRLPAPQTPRTTGMKGESPDSGRKSAFLKTRGDGSLRSPPWRSEKKYKGFKAHLRARHEASAQGIQSTPDATQHQRCQSAPAILQRSVWDIFQPAISAPDFQSALLARNAGLRRANEVFHGFALRGQVETRADAGQGPSN